MYHGPIAGTKEKSGRPIAKAIRLDSKNLWAYFTLPVNAGIRNEMGNSGIRRG
jgi:hypothetical protein